MNKHNSNLRIKSCFNIIPHSADLVELRKGVWNPISFTVKDEQAKGKLYKIIKDLNGDNSVTDITKKHQVSRGDVEGVLDHLQQLGVIEHASATLLDYYIDQACPSVMQRLYPAETIKNKKMLLIGCNKINKLIKNMLADYFDDQNMIALTEDNILIKHLHSFDNDWLYDTHSKESMIQAYTEWKDYFVIFSQSILDPMTLIKWNAIAHELKIPWISGSIDGPFLFIGPLLYGQGGPCYQCFENRVTMNLREHASYVKYKNFIIDKKVEHSKPIPYLFPLMNLVASHIALEVINYLSTGASFTRNKVLSIYLPTMEIIFNEVLRLSSCPVCGPVEHRDNQQLYFDYQTILTGDKQ